MKQIYKLLLLLVLFSTIWGCSQERQTVRGKFVFGSNRYLDFGYPAHILKNGKIKLLGKRIYAPVWSPNGKLIACLVSKKSNEEIGKNGILLVDENGNKHGFFETISTPLSCSWFPSGDKVAYAVDPLRNPKINIYDFKEQKETTIFKLDGQTDITGVNVSPTGDTIMFTKGKPNRGTYLINSDGSNLRFIRDYISRPAWYPDGKNILYITNVGDDGKLLTDVGGYFFKMDIKTKKIEKLRLNAQFISNLKVSRDGRYFYYTVPYLGGEVIAASPVDGEAKQFYITKPVEIKPMRYSQDKRPDWYQGE